jgi:hypothetical protein
MAISDADKKELDKLQKKLTATDIVRRNTEKQIQAIVNKQYVGRNVIICKAISPKEAAITPLTLPDDTNRVMSNSRIEELRQRQLRQVFSHNLNYFDYKKDGYFFKSDKSMAVIFSLKDNCIEYYGKEPLDDRTAMAIAELAGKKVRCSSVELHGNDGFIMAISMALQKYHVNYSMPPTEPEETATDTTPRTNVLKPSGKKITR